MDALENPRFRLYRQEPGGPSLEEMMRLEAGEMSDRQDAEAMLFRYIIAAACRFDTHPDIPLGLAAYLGKVNDLPSGRILEAAVPLSAGVEAGERIDKLNRALEELAPEIKPPRASEVCDDGRCWISVQTREPSSIDRKKEHLDELWRPTETVPASRAVYQGKDPAGSRPVFFRVVMLALLAIAVFLGARTFGCTPKNFFKKPPGPLEEHTAVPVNAPAEDIFGASGTGNAASDSPPDKVTGILPHDGSDVDFPGEGGNGTLPF